MTALKPRTFEAAKPKTDQNQQKKAVTTRRKPLMISYQNEFDIKRGAIMLQKVINGNAALDKDPMDSELAQMLESAKEREENYRKRDFKAFRKTISDNKQLIKDTK